MPFYTAQPNDCIASIAKFHGLALEKIWDHPKNISLREIRQDPNICSSGDRVYIPDVNKGEYNSNTGESHHFVLRLHDSLLKLVLKIGDDPIADASYSLEINDIIRSGRTNSKGCLEESIPPQATQGHLFLDDWGLIQLELGRLNPVDSIEGIQQRLSNLGFYCGPSDGLKGSKTEAAVQAWQQEKGLIVDGIIGPQTQESLRSEYGC